MMLMVLIGRFPHRTVTIMYFPNMSLSIDVAQQSIWIAMYPMVPVGGYADQLYNTTVTVL